MDAISTAAEAASAALILASWVSEVFLAALFLRVVLLPSITQTNARFWSTFSSSASNGNLLVVEKEFDLLVEYWLFQTFRGCARKLTVRRTAAAARFRNIILQTERAIRSTQYSLRSARFPKSSLDPPKGDLDAKIQWLYDFWSVLCFVG